MEARQARTATARQGVRCRQVGRQAQPTTTMCAWSAGKCVAKWWVQARKPEAGAGQAPPEGSGSVSALRSVLTPN